MHQYQTNWTVRFIYSMHIPHFSSYEKFMFITKWNGFGGNQGRHHLTRFLLLTIFTHKNKIEFLDLCDTYSSYNIFFILREAKSNSNQHKWIRYINNVLCNNFVEMRIEHRNRLPCCFVLNLLWLYISFWPGKFARTLFSPAGILAIRSAQ